MRTWQKRLLRLVAVALLALLVTPWLTRDRTTNAAATLDYLNPLVRQSVVYVSPATESVQWRANNHGGLDYHYHVTGYDDAGKPRQLQLTASDHPLAADQYLAVTTKGQTVLRWKPIIPAQVPANARRHLLPIE